MIDEVRVKGVKPIVQRRSSTCWYACYQMLYKWKGIGVSEVEDRIKKSQTDEQKDADPPIADFDYMCDHGIGTSDLKPVARALKLEWGGGGGKDTTISALLYALDKFGPIWIAGAWHGHSHVILLIGAKRGKVPMVNFLNPWLQYGGKQEIQRPLSWLNKGRGTWRNAVGSIVHGPQRKQVKHKDYFDD